MRSSDIWEFGRMSNHLFIAQLTTEMIGDDVSQDTVEPSDHAIGITKLTPPFESAEVSRLKQFFGDRAIMNASSHEVEKIATATQ